MPRKRLTPLPTGICTRCGQRDDSVELIAKHGSSIVRQQLCSPCLAALAPTVPAGAKDRLVLEGRLRRRYAIGALDYEAMLVFQDGRCAICGEVPVRDKTLHVDHDHRTGAVRGLLCTRCNTGIGWWQDNGLRMFKAAAYVMGML